MVWRNPHFGPDTWPAQDCGTAAFSWLARALASARRLFADVKIRRRERSLSLRESLSLGDRRLLALVECEGQRFLVGVTNHGITLLQRWHKGQSPQRDSFEPAAGECN